MLKLISRISTKRVEISIGEAINWNKHLTVNSKQARNEEKQKNQNK